MKENVTAPVKVVEVAERPGDTDVHDQAADPDEELIRWSLSLSMKERLAVLQDFVETFWTPQHG